MVAVISPTESRNPRTIDIDRVSTLQLLQMLNAEDQLVAGAVRAVLPDLVTLVEAAATSLARGGRVHYFGAGTSGRIAVMDAAEVPPTFGLARGTFLAHHAGGELALEQPIEEAEDDEQLGARESEAVAPGDVVIGVTASGRTPYVAGALRATRSRAEITALVTANPTPPLGRLADVVLGVDVGPEAIAGSTRLKAATAQKLVLNCFSTATMVRLGRTYSNLMVEVAPSNEKLRGRIVKILIEASGESEQTCREMLAATNNNLKLALVCLLSPTTPFVAERALDSVGGRVAAALSLLEVERDATPLAPGDRVDR